MHKIISLSLLLFIGGAVSPAMAQSTSPDYGMLNRDKTKGPRTPSEDFIVCHYGTGWIDFEFPESVESVDAVLYQYNIPVWQGEASVSSTCVDIPVVYGECTLTCTSQDGAQYSGNLYFKISNK